MLKLTKYTFQMVRHMPGPENLQIDYISGNKCFYWIPYPRKYVRRHQDICTTLTSTRDIVNLVIFRSGQAVI